jgi:alkanesulfonate monooxygenase SsuD/methylene tetrahydromethanopterin reductase-like flavin-dependent oxidoreductase (luciferase family)
MAETGPAGARHPLHFGIVIGQHQLTWEQILAQAKLGEELGFDSVWVFDHFSALYGDPDGPCLEASTLMAALARETSRVKLGCLVYGNTHRNPGVFLKEMVTVDHLSGGRLILGIGTGWNEREHDAYGLTLHSPGDRVQLLDEALTVMRSLLTERRTSFEGRFYRFHDAPFSPKPVQAKLPILVGGKRPKMLRVVARHADLWDSGGTPDDVRRSNAEFEIACREVGRDPAEVVRSVSLGADRLEADAGFADLVRAYRAAGASQFLFDFPLTPAGQEAAARVAREAIPALRAEGGAEGR